ncbi:MULTISPECIES: cation:dicarboxylate symporter family transporter [Paraburkholderia]|jgi:Na+/H+-dicarboxylate symporters|uniref:Aerobic C4-dicarboxylate transport protein n=2 Tax=Paraburkholderia TaxID=1822464 RepID=A0A1G8K0T9_9BURK|nr:MULTISPECIES: cation:dicarboxylase symporter family transporter [Paraburkholderia]MBK5048549.1 cation:dicarboxylase symporter family transporter [Burkholderia sp. R-70006]MBK5060862.1 cation:dicarboxylase symporter family transporter [Burkholderia sp. R-70199]MBK5120542.1 cation:dicarboxylase symporter family transporter [Burkholderia sp. R-69980]MBK5166061.1 cation:dicarboxylase symporter family transporter [Burkholderia sp. R-70211]MBK5180618.1 cation:dicarboxylase symporter family transp
MNVLRKLHVQVLIGLACAVVLGLAAPQSAIAMKPLGQGFIALLKMMLAPIIFCTLVQGLAHVKDLRMLGRMGVKSLVYFEVVSTFAMVLGFAMVNLFQPGAGLHASNIAESAEALKTTSGAANISAVNYLLSLIPHTLVDAFAKGDIVQVLIISLLAGLALNMAVGADSVILRGIDEAQNVLFRMLAFIMKLAPLGAFGAMAAAIGSYGGMTLVYLLKVIVLYYVTSLFFVFGVLGSISWGIGLPFFSVLRLIRDEILLIFGTASSEVAFPRLVEKLQKAGCDEVVVGFVLPAGYSFNLDGTSIYMAIAIGFIAQATDTPFSLWQQLGLLAILSLTSKGGTTVAGGAFVKLAATLQSVHTLPVGGLGLLFGIDRVMATATALVNVVGNTMAVFAISRWEGAFDAEAYARETGKRPRSSCLKLRKPAAQAGAVQSN